MAVSVSNRFTSPAIAPVGTKTSAASGAKAIAHTPAVTAADRDTQIQLQNTLRQLGFDVGTATKTSANTWKVQVHRFDAAKATGEFRGLLAVNAKSTKPAAKGAKSAHPTGKQAPAPAAASRSTSLQGKSSSKGFVSGEHSGMTREGVAQGSTRGATSNQMTSAGHTNSETDTMLAGMDKSSHEHDHAEGPGSGTNPGGDNGTGGIDKEKVGDGTGTGELTGMTPGSTGTGSGNDSGTGGIEARRGGSGVGEVTVRV